MSVVFFTGISKDIAQCNEIQMHFSKDFLQLSLMNNYAQHKIYLKKRFVPVRQMTDRIRKVG